MCVAKNTLLFIQQLLYYIYNMVKHKQKGFTIIEVVLVLAIAGLIFLVIFFAIPQLQKSRRDTQRKSDVGKVLGMILEYASSNGGVVPNDDPSLAAFNSQYLTSNAKLKEPSTGQAYQMKWWGDDPPNELGYLFYNHQATCTNGHLTVNTSLYSNNQIAVAINLENGTYCQANG
jgi:prepilin-type N-terminal cleavage/methylation domain-containing protein